LVHKSFRIHGGDAQALAGPVEAGYVHVRPEKKDILLIWTREGFKSFENLLPVVKNHCRGVKNQISKWLDFRLLPASRIHGKVHAQHVVRKDLSKPKLVFIVGLRRCSTAR